MSASPTSEHAPPSVAGDERPAAAPGGVTRGAGMSDLASALTTTGTHRIPLAATGPGESLGATGGVAPAVASTHDLAGSGRATAAESAARTTERLHLLAEALDGYVYEWDVRTGQVARSDGILAVLGFRSDEVPAGADWWRERMHPDDRAGRVAASLAAFEDPTVDRLTTEFRMQARDGSWRWLVDRARLVRDGAGRVMRVVGIATDVTEEHDRQLALEASQAAERTARARAGHLQALSARLNRAASQDEIVAAILDGVVHAVAAEAVSLARVQHDADGEPVAFELMGALGFANHATERHHRFPYRPGRPLSAAAGQRRPVFVASPDAWRAEWPSTTQDLADLGVAAFAAVPVCAAGRTLAVLALGFRHARAFPDDERAFLATVAEQCALAFERQRLHDAELRHAAEQAALLATIQDGFVAFDEGLRYTYVNAEAAALLGRTPADLLGRSVDEVFPAAARSEFRLGLSRVQASRETVSVEGYSHVTRRWLEARIFPAPSGVTMTFRDVTASRRNLDAAAFTAEASHLLSASLDYEATLRAVAAAAVPRLGDWCAVDMLVDPTARAWPPTVERLAVVHQDPAMLALGEEFSRRFPPDWSAETGMAAVLRDGTPMFVPEVTEAMVLARARDPEHLDYLRRLRFSSIIVVPLVARELTLGALTLCMTESGRRYDDADLALAQDLARRAAVAVDNARLFREAERARRDAEQANRAKSEFLATMSHELRTPLNAIGGYTELLQIGVRGALPPAAHEDLARIQRSQQHLLGLINEVLNYARLEAGTVRFELCDLDAADALREVETLMRPQIAARELAFAWDECEPELRVYADAEKVRQVLLNLLSNAVKFTERGGSITAGCRRLSPCEGGPGVAELWVRDTGVGVAPEQLERIFEPFVQVGRTLSAPSEGTGLGLAISRDLARGMRGDLKVESTVGRGSTFRLHLPVSAPSASHTGGHS
jgi:PAS domain S-box-containing protein